MFNAKKKTTAKPALKTKPHLILKALGNPYRFKIADTLIDEGELTVSQLNKTIKVNQPALSQHLSKMKAAGVLVSRREERNIHYQLAGPRVVDIINRARIFAELGA